MGAKRMRTSRQQLIEEPATLADRTANGAGADAEPARELALEEGYRQGIEAAAKLIECGCKALLHGKGECQFPGNCSLEDAAAIRALGTSCEQLNKAVSNVRDQQENEPGAHGERGRVLEEAATLLEREADELDGLVDSVSHHLRSKAKTIRALSSPDHADAGKVEGDEPIACVGEMQTSSGADYYVCVKVGGREITPHMFKERWKAEYEVAEWLWLFNGGEKPDLLAYGPLPSAPSQEVAGS